MSKKTRKALKKARMEIGTLKHALRSEMSQVVYWALILSVAFLSGLQVFLLTKLVEVL